MEKCRDHFEVWGRHDFESLAEARDETDAFIERYNRGWLLERHGYRTPAQIRQEFALTAA